MPHAEPPYLHADGEHQQAHDRRQERQPRRQAERVGPVQQRALMLNRSGVPVNE